ncbi:acetolactate synthase, small subunit [Sedimentisphaera cyanobacteriorum]|uniref:Acetolactate synthase, small subunit n=1 Tax=Sedimentisphaera cyanobacteriorum TaxID=1940790 RepID=A0A1Q2HPZ6_9BACT|nr:ACT domain-containing protein [Sedimentisphaera cyanobacteriorum]AQQ09315.1 acetolactate synthase, small subunit [Sedimentisphaera cyanobacteriorum]
MKITQISVFLENRAGRLSEVCRLFGKNDIDIRALNIAETESFGVMRVIVNKPEKAIEVLRNNNVTANITDVVAVEIQDRPGGLSEVLDTVTDNGLNVEYMYGFMERQQGKAIMVFRFENPEKAANVLSEKGLNVLSSDVIL